MPVRAENIRNIALVGHAGCGTTSLTEAMAVATGARGRAGRIEDGSTLMDTDPEEIARGTSLSLGVADLDWTPDSGERHLLTLLDAPGTPDFAGAMDAALAVADVALIVVSAVDGVQPGTVAAWRRAAELDLPVMAVVTKEDKARAHFTDVLAQLRDLVNGSGVAVLPLEMPLGEEENLHGIADILTETGVVYDSQGHHTEPIPDDLASAEHLLHEEVAEEIVSHDDEQLERYLDGDEPGATELERTLRAEVLARQAMPLLVTSAYENVGIEELLNYLCELAPGPLDRPARILVGVTADGDASDAVLTDLPADPDGELVLQVFRTLTDPYVGLVSYLKVLSGTLGTSANLSNATTGETERLHAPFRLRGTEHLPTNGAVAGQIVGAAKLTGSPTGSLLVSKPAPVRPYLPSPRAAGYGVALVPETPSDEEKLSAALARLILADPTLEVEQTAGQTVLRGLGDQHVAVALERMARLLGVHVSTEPVAVGYTETIATSVEAEGRLKKQSGGHGQFAVVQLRVSPMPRGGGVEFVDSVVGGSVPRQFIPAVERGVHDAMVQGGPAGHRVVDLRVELLEGKAHSVDSSEMAFRTAGALGVKAALESAGTIVLEPMTSLQVRVPLESQGEVLGDIASRRGQVMGTAMSEDGSDVIVTARVPQRSLDRYLMDLRAMTHGRGEVTAQPDGFDEAHG